MPKITVESKLSEERLAQFAVKRWPVWEKEVSEFPWQYQDTEVAYILEGEVVVTPVDGDAVHFASGDLVTFPAGLRCVWKIIKPLRKHYSFDFPNGV